MLPICDCAEQRGGAGVFRWRVIQPTCRNFDLHPKVKAPRPIDRGDTITNFGHCPGCNVGAGQPHRDICSRSGEWWDANAVTVEAIAAQLAPFLPTAPYFAPPTWAIGNAHPELDWLRNAASDAAIERDTASALGPVERPIDEIRAQVEVEFEHVKLGLRWAYPSQAYRVAGSREGGALVYRKNASKAWIESKWRRGSNPVPAGGPVVDIEMDVYFTTPVPVAAPRAPALAELPCSTCGERHELEAFPIGAVVRVLAQRARVKRDFVGLVGVVREWSQMGGPIRVRLQFEGLDEFDCPLRENFHPCQLELLDRGNLR